MWMQQNVGRTDRFLRITLGGLLLAASAARMAQARTPMAGVGTGLLGGMMLAEGVLGSCPYYGLLGIDTRERPDPDTVGMAESI